MILKVGQEWENDHFVMKITRMRRGKITHAAHKNKTSGDIRRVSYGVQPKTWEDTQRAGAKLTPSSAFKHFYKSIRK